MTTNLDEDLPAPPTTSLLEQPIFSTPCTWLARIPESEEEKANVKDSVTSILLARGHGEGVDASGLSGHPAIREFKFGGSFMVGDGGAEEMKKMAPVANKSKEKGRYQWVTW